MTTVTNSSAMTMKRRRDGAVVAACGPRGEAGDNTPRGEAGDNTPRGEAGDNTPRGEAGDDAAPGKGEASCMVLRANRFPPIVSQRIRRTLHAGLVVGSLRRAWPAVQCAARHVPWPALRG